MAYFITNIQATEPTTGSYTDGHPTSIRNDYGVLRGGGTVASTASFSGTSFGEDNPITTIISGTGPVDAAIKVGTPTFNQGAQVINAIQTGIAGQSNTTLQGGQSDSANMAHTPLQLDVLRTYYYKTAITAGNWNEFTASFSSIGNSAVSGVWNISVGVENTSTLIASGTDIAANPKAALPGRLTFRDGSPNPIQTGYGSRYNW